ncbi:hypothetical protein E3T26_14795 [Cryobacterium sp. TMT1-21]|uniref:Phospholipase n=1 Tax=Cryobacterium shii TaxID=1259235 RepID=A0AAQ2C9P5_9MICO|nr:hypothetical protein E3O49_00815 [Cryobacterium shii]TFC81113.1 hypothetical protein E3T24_15480 [Cryobacterium sp. TmT2-59]TFD09053.1 hypothetical protein E3T26_14795 [Cryobacterium sp. TMT1-21]TFD18854.1 hypothetical protein E3T42_04810 [Cryobacterium sp. TMT4-10]TFD21974.1 hypothetical protein E3T32_07320 [Cryobacterium sp. TMT2-23]TFD43209.1 hypothetical protein E3T37_01465 [Cryobacterium sp. TMT2-10]
MAILAGSALAIAGLVVGGTFATQSAVAAQDRVSATAALAESTGVHPEQLDAYHGIAKAHTQHNASVALDQANQVLSATQGKADASALTQVTSSLAGYEVLPLDEISSLTSKTKTETTALAAAAAEADRAAAAAAVAAAAAAEANRVTSLAAGNTPAGAKATAQAMALSQYGWGSDQFSCLSQLWQKESEWKYDAVNSNGGATGIPQALPGSKMASAGTDWATNATTQIAWGLQYIKASSYGTPCAAWAHSQAVNWY